MTINGRVRVKCLGGPDPAPRLPTLAVELKLMKKAALQVGFVTALNNRKNWKQRYSCAINEIYSV